MPNYQLSPDAELNLLEIALYGLEHFGLKKSNDYRDKLIRRFLAISEEPFLYPAVNHIYEGYRRSVCGVHSIYYRVENNDSVKIMLIIGRQKFPY